MNSCQSQLLGLLSMSLFGCSCHISVDDYTQLLLEAKNQAVVTLVYSSIDKTKLTSETGIQWSDSASAFFASTIRVIHNHVVLHKWMEDAGVPYVVLKGCASAAYYPKPQLRTMGDVDFLVPEQFLDKAGAILEREGMTQRDGNRTSHIEYGKVGMDYELHFSLVGMPNGEVGKIIKKYTQDIFESSSVQKVGNGFARMPSPFHHGIILLLHTCQHLTGEGIGLRHLCDWAVFANSFSDSEFCSIFEDCLKQIGLWRFAQVLTRTSIKYLGADEKTWAQCDELLVDSLIEDVLSAGNFGRKDSATKSIESMLISRGKENLSESGMRSHMVKHVNELIYRRWPSSQKNKMLLLVGWMYFGGRRIWREMTGKIRKTNIKKVINSAEKRSELYRQLSLFKSEES